jgi:hypothetical protein
MHSYAISDNAGFFNDKLIKSIDKKRSDVASFGGCIGRMKSTSQ